MEDVLDQIFKLSRLLVSLIHSQSDAVADNYDDDYRLKTFPFDNFEREAVDHDGNASEFLTACQHWPAIFASIDQLKTVDLSYNLDQIVLSHDFALILREVLAFSVSVVPLAKSLLINLTIAVLSQPVVDLVHQDRISVIPPISKCFCLSYGAL